MGPEDGARDELSPAEQRVAELLGALAGEVVATRADLRSSVVRRLRRQQDGRIAVLVASGLLAAVMSGMAGLAPAATPGKRDR
jgi:hypothetical protein